MPIRLTVFLAITLLAAPAMAQTGNAVGSGLGSNSGSMSGPNIDVVNGTNANGTPRQQSPGSSMTVGAGNSTMLPGITGSSTGTAKLPKPTVTGVTQGTTKTKQNP
ncbi:MAG: hypothetical protein B7Z75_05985 [Acidocella sp. 20-57-95]|nr:MAG: hypothetical protein B7Z75_05985 [Acidocella sp. 20-57-95]HQT65604.1 hypothetical protein [Acidocella sp.]